VNCPFTKEQYEAFLDALLTAQERSGAYRRGQRDILGACLPIEEIARRGRDTLRFGPMKPAGLTDPRTGRWPYAAVQLRREDVRAGSFNLVGFPESHALRRPERVLRMIPGLERAEFLRFGQVHRNTYINGPPCWRRLYNMRLGRERVFRWADFGSRRVRGVDRDGSGGGFVEHPPMLGETVRTFPRSTAIGSCVLTLREPIRRITAGEYHLRLVAEAGASAERQEVRQAEVCRKALAALDEFRYATCLSFMRR